MKYSKEFKEEALKLSDEIGLKKAAQQLGIQYYTLSDWRSKRNAAAKAKKYQIWLSLSLITTYTASLKSHKLHNLAFYSIAVRNYSPQIRKDML